MGDMDEVSAWITVSESEEKSEVGDSDGRVTAGSCVVVVEDDPFALALVAALVLTDLDGESFCPEIF